MPVHWIPGEGFFGNSFLAGDVLIDAGVSPAAVEHFRNRIGIIALTHCHFDHIAHLREIAHLTGAEIAIHECDAEGLINGTDSLAMHFGSHPPGIIPDIILGEGDRIGDLLVLHTPGHTRGSVCFYDERERSLFSGDTVFSDGGFGRYDFPGGSRDDLVVSVRRLAGMDVDGLYPGHGEPVRSGGARHIRAACTMLVKGYG